MARLGGNRAIYEEIAIAFGRVLAPNVPSRVERLPSFAGQDQRFMGGLRKQMDGDEIDAPYDTLQFDIGAADARQTRRNPSRISTSRVSI